MKFTILTYFLIFYTTTLFGQLTINPKIKNEYLKLFNKQPADSRNMRYVGEDTIGLAFITAGKRDTINIKDYQKDHESPSFDTQLIEVDSNGNPLPPRKVDTVKANTWMFCVSILVNDTLYIKGVWGLISGFSWTIKIHKNQIDARYQENREDDSVYHKIIDGARSTEIDLKVKVHKLILNKWPIKPGTEFYGKAILETEPFFEDDSKSKAGYIKSKYRCSLLFVSKAKRAKI